nr:hypothetical protein [Tanacetum cinerariifolium]
MRRWSSQSSQRLAHAEFLNTEGTRFTAEATISGINTNREWYLLPTLSINTNKNITEYNRPRLQKSLGAPGAVEWRLAINRLYGD